MGTKASPNWTDLLKDNPFIVSTTQKKKKAPASPEQREELLKFILENPELVTHSSTKENELALWSDVTEKLNSMKPEKSMVFWKDFFKRWITSIESKNVNSMTLLDHSLMKFLKNINYNNENVDELPKSKPPIRKRMSVEDIVNNLKEVEEEKTKLKLDIDSMEIKRVECKKYIIDLTKKIKAKKRKCEQLAVKKANLNNKKRKIEEKKNQDKD